MSKLTCIEIKNTSTYFASHRLKKLAFKTYSRVSSFPPLFMTSPTISFIT